MALTDLLRTVRRAQGLTLRELAVRVGTTTNALWELESGRSSMALFDKAAGALCIDWAGFGRGSSVSDRLVYLRSRLGLTRAEVAQRAELSVAAAHRVEQGRAHMRSAEAIAAVLAPHARVAKAKVWAPPDKRDVRLTPPDFIDRLRAVVGTIDLDPCGHPASYVGARESYLHDGLVRPWRGDVVFVNPPYSESDRWLRRAFDAWASKEARTIVLLMPVRSHTRTWQEVTPSADVLLLRGRLKFMDGQRKQMLNHAPFPLAVIFFGATEEQVSAARGLWQNVPILRTSRNGE